VGKFGISAGLSSCASCGAGNFTNETGTIECQRCPAGTYSPVASESTRCVACADGLFASTAGQTQCQQCSQKCVLGSAYTEVNCTASTNRVCSPCRLNPECGIGTTSNVTWCPPSGWFDCIACPALGNDYVHLVPSYSCRTCNMQSCGGTPGTYKSGACPDRPGQFDLGDTFSCGRCLGCNYRQYVQSWSLCSGQLDFRFDLVTTSTELCQACLTVCKPGQYITNLCNGRTTNNTETCADCASCPHGHYHAKNLVGYMHPDYEGKPWSPGYVEPACTGTGILASDGVGDCERCDQCEQGKYASGVGRCTGNGIWKDRFTCTECKPCASGYEHVAPCDGLSFNDSCKLCPACPMNHHISSYWNSTSRRMVCGCSRCLDAPGDVCKMHEYKTNLTCTGSAPYDEVGCDYMAVFLKIVVWLHNEINVFMITESRARLLGKFSLLRQSMYDYRVTY
jgi:hypothetical protein